MVRTSGCGSTIVDLQPEFQMREVSKRIMAMLKIGKTNRRTASAKLLTLAALAAAIGLAQSASGQASSAEGSALCSMAALKGQYSWLGHGYEKVPDENDPNKTVTIPAASIALLTFDGRGNFNLLIDVVFDGVMLRENFRTSDTYVVQSDCTGVLGSGNNGPTFDILVVRDGSSFLLIDKTPGGTGASEVKRVAK